MFKLLLEKRFGSLLKWGGLSFCIFCNVYLSGEEPEFARAEFSTLSWSGVIRDLVYMQQGQPVAITIPDGAPAPVRIYQGVPQLAFYRPGRDEEGNVTYTEVGSVVLAAGNSRPLLLFVPRHDSDHYRVVAFDASQAEFPVNAFNFINLTDAPLSIRVDEKLATLRGHTNFILDMDSDKQANVSVQMATGREDGGWSRIYSSRWSSLGDRRAWVFINLDESSQPSIRKYYQTVSPAIH